MANVVHCLVYGVFIVIFIIAISILIAKWYYGFNALQWYYGKDATRVDRAESLPLIAREIESEFTTD